MKEISVLIPWLAFFCGAVMIGKALRLGEVRRELVATSRMRIAGSLALALAVPSLTRAANDLRASVESGNAIIMYLCGVFAAIGIVTAGVSMMAGRPTIAKWAFAGGMVSGLGFAIVKTMWSSFGLTSADVGSFSP